MSSRLDKIRISAGGYLLADEWIYDRHTKKGTTTYDVDITDDALYHLYDHCNIELGTTFKDILLLVERINNYDALSPLLTGGPWLKEMVEEGLTESEKKQDIKIIFMNWSTNITNDIYMTDRPIFNINVDVYGAKRDSLETYALDFTPLNELTDCIVSVDVDFRVMDNRDDRDEVVVDVCRDYTLLDILRGLFWELSFHGSPKMRTEKLERFKETIRQVNSGEKKTIPWKQIKRKKQEKSDE